GGAVPGQPGGNPADALDVRVAVLLREPEALREMRTDDVAVQVLDEMAAALELGADDLRDRRLACPGEPGEPERKALGLELCAAKRRGGRGLGKPRGFPSTVRLVRHLTPSHRWVCLRGCRTRACRSRPSGLRAPPRRGGGGGGGAGARATGC